MENIMESGKGCSKFILPYGKPMVQQNPDDAIDLSILDVRGDASDLAISYLDTFANCFCDGGKHYFDAHMKSELPSIRKETVMLKDGVCKNITPYLTEKIRESNYMILELDECKINVFGYKREDVYPHLLCIYGFDMENQLFFFADFMNWHGYRKLSASFQEIESAYQSIRHWLRKKNEGCREKIQYAIQQKKYVRNEGKEPEWEEIAERINCFMNASYYNPEHIPDPETTILRFDPGGNRYYEVENHKIYGKDVFSGVIEHTRRCMEDEHYIFEFKGIYLFYAYLMMMEVRIGYFHGRYEKKGELAAAEKMGRLGKVCEGLIDCAQVAVTMGVKYDLTKQQVILKRLVKRLEPISEQLLEILNEFMHIVNMAPHA